MWVSALSDPPPVNLFCFSKNGAGNRILALLSKHVVSSAWICLLNGEWRHTHGWTRFLLIALHMSRLLHPSFFSQVHIVNTHVFSIGATFLIHFKDISNTASVHKYYHHIIVIRNNYLLQHKIKAQFIWKKMLLILVFPIKGSHGSGSSHSNLMTLTHKNAIVGF